MNSNSKEGRTPLVSIIIVNFNGGPLLLEAVTAALASSIPAELLISDNGSTDGSLNAIYQMFGKDPRVQIISNGANLGFSKANNVALKMAKGRYVLLLNPDCIIRTDTLSKLLAVMASNPDVGMAGCLIRNPDGSEQAGCRRAVPTPWRTLVRVLHLNKFFPRTPRFRTFLLHQEPLPTEPCEVEAISGAFMLIRRDAMNQVGPLDEEYFMHCEDLDWCMRFRKAKWKVLFVPNVEVLHYKGTCSKNYPIRVLFHMHRGMIRFYRKFFRKQYPLPLMTMVMIAAWTRFTLLITRELISGRLHKQINSGPISISPRFQERRKSPPVVAYIGPERRAHRSADNSLSAFGKLEAQRHTLKRE